MHEQDWRFKSKWTKETRVQGWKCLQAFEFRRLLNWVQTFKGEHCLNRKRTNDALKLNDRTLDIKITSVTRKLLDSTQSCWTASLGFFKLQEYVFTDTLQQRNKTTKRDVVKMTHPSPGGSTSAGAAPLQTPPPRWACAGRCLHRASRSNYSPTCTCERTATPYSQPAGRTKSIISTFFLLCSLFFLNKMIQLKQSWHHLSRRHKKDLMGCFSTRGTKSLASIILFHTERMFIHLPPSVVG